MGEQRVPLQASSWMSCNSQQPHELTLASHAPLLKTPRPTEAQHAEARPCWPGAWLQRQVGPHRPPLAAAASPAQRLWRARPRLPQSRPTFVIVQLLIRSMASHFHTVAGTRSRNVVGHCRTWVRSMGTASQDALRVSGKRRHTSLVQLTVSTKRDLVAAHKQAESDASRRSQANMLSCTLQRNPV